MVDATNRVTRRAWIAASVATPGSRAAQSAAPAPGTYVYEGGAGTLETGPDGRFKIDTVGATLHLQPAPHRAGPGPGWRSRPKYQPTPLAYGRHQLQSDQRQESWRDARHLRRRLHPSRPGLHADYGEHHARGVFKRQYNAKQYAQAQTPLAPVQVLALPWE